MVLGKDGISKKVENIGEHASKGNIVSVTDKKDSKDGMRVNVISATKWDGIEVVSSGYSRWMV